MPRSFFSKTNKVPLNVKGRLLPQFQHLPAAFSPERESSSPLHRKSIALRPVASPRFFHGANQRPLPDRKQSLAHTSSFQSSSFRGVGGSALPPSGTPNRNQSFVHTLSQKLNDAALIDSNFYSSKWPHKGSKIIYIKWERNAYQNQLWLIANIKSQL